MSLKKSLGDSVVTVSFSKVRKGVGETEGPMVVSEEFCGLGLCVKDGPAVVSFDGK